MADSLVLHHHTCDHDESKEEEEGYQEDDSPKSPSNSHFSPHKVRELEASLARVELCLHELHHRSLASADHLQKATLLWDKKLDAEIQKHALSHQERMEKLEEHFEGQFVSKSYGKLMEWMERQEARWKSTETLIGSHQDSIMQKVLPQISASLQTSLATWQRNQEIEIARKLEESSATRLEYDKSLAAKKQEEEDFLATQISKYEAERRHDFLGKQDMISRITQLERQLATWQSKFLIARLCECFKKVRRHVLGAAWRKLRNFSRFRKNREVEMYAKGLRVWRALLKRKIKVLRRAHNKWKASAVYLRQEEALNENRRIFLINSLERMTTRPVRAAWTQWRRACLLMRSSQNFRKNDASSGSSSSSSSSSSESCSLSPSGSARNSSLNESGARNFSLNDECSVNRPSLSRRRRVSTYVTATEQTTPGQSKTRRQARSSFPSRGATTADEALEKFCFRSKKFSDFESSFAKAVSEATQELRNTAAEMSLTLTKAARLKGGGKSFREDSGEPRGISQKISFLGNDVSGQIQMLGSELQSVQEKELPKLFSQNSRNFQSLSHRLADFSDCISRILTNLIAPAVGALQAELAATQARLDELFAANLENLRKSEREQAARTDATMKEFLDSNIQNIESRLESYGMQILEMRKRQDVLESSCESSGDSQKLFQRNFELFSKDAKETHESLENSLKKGLKKLQAKLRRPRRPDFIEVTQAFRRIEDRCSVLKFVGPVSEEESEILARCAEECARFVADSADLEALQKVICGANMDALIYCEDELEAKREEVQADLIHTLEVALEEEIGPPRCGVGHEARNRTLRIVRNSMRVAVSKYNQVVVEANTRIGRIKAAPAPVCVACDRPLRSKVPRRQGALREISGNLSKGCSKMAGVQRFSDFGVSENANSPNADFDQAGKKIGKTHFQRPRTAPSLTAVNGSSSSTSGMPAAIARERRGRRNSGPLPATDDASRNGTEEESDNEDPFILRGAATGHHRPHHSLMEGR